MDRRPLLIACFLVGATIFFSPAWAGMRVSALALFKDKALIEIDGKQRVLAKGETSPEGVFLVSASSKAAEIEIKGERSVLHLDERISADFGVSAQPAIVRLIPNAGGHYLVDGKINGQGIEFLVDTGATLIAMSKPAAKRIGLQFRVDGERGQVKTASGIADGYYLMLGEVRVRTMTLHNVAAVVVDGDYPATALLGQSFLNRIDMRRDGAVMELIAR